MGKRKSPIAKSLTNNSIAGIFSAIEIHNKPTFKYRYEIVVLLVLNSWELLIKAYLYKFHKDIKLFNPDKTTKPFENCLNIVNEKLGKEFNIIKENLLALYNYRNQVAHFYISELDPIIYSLISKNIIFYSKFLSDHFKIDLSKTSDLILLPIGFKKPISPFDFISNKSLIEESSVEIKEFIKILSDASRRLNENDIDDTIFVNFKMNLTNINRIKNADIVAGIDNSSVNDYSFIINKESKKVISSNKGESVILTRDKSISQGTILYEELNEGIFDEINNLIDANYLLAKGKREFMLGVALYYRIYAERQHVDYNVNKFELLAKAGMIDFYVPFLFWLTKLPVENIVKLLFELFVQCKSPKIHNLNKIIILLGNEATEMFCKFYEKKFENLVQKPDFYFSFMELKKSKIQNKTLRVLKSNMNKKFIISDNSGDFTYGKFINDNNLAVNYLSNICLSVFNGLAANRSFAREIDFLSYGLEIEKRKEEITYELKKHIKLFEDYTDSLKNNCV